MKKHSKSEFIVFQETASTIFLSRKGEKISVSKNLDSLSNTLSRPLKAYILGNNDLEVTEIQPIQNYYKIKNSAMLVVDSLAIYMPLQIHPETVLLTQSPKINLQRLIEILQPKTIVADGSNYKSYVNRWQKTCENKKIKFHDTSKMGAFVIDY
jgi:competence protein ComEC